MLHLQRSSKTIVQVKLCWEGTFLVGQRGAIESGRQELFRKILHTFPPSFPSSPSSRVQHWMDTLVVAEGAADALHLLVLRADASLFPEIPGDVCGHYPIGVLRKHLSKSRGI